MSDVHSSVPGDEAYKPKPPHVPHDYLDGVLPFPNPAPKIPEPQHRLRASHQILSVYDRKGRHYSQPFYAKTLAVGVRNILPVVQDKNSMLAKFPEDHVLVRVGEFYEETGLIDGLVEPEVITEIKALITVHQASEGFTNE